MKIPLSWLRDYVDLTLPVPELVERLSLAGLEVAGVRPYGLPMPDGLPFKPAEESPVWSREHVIVARVKSVEKHPNADKLKLVHLDYGKPEPKVVVTGAPNVNIGDSGQNVIVGLTGCTYRDGHVDPPKLSVLKPTKLRGVPSDAMVMSAFELGIHEDHDGIIILEADAPVGTPLADFMGDLVIEVDVLPNMARCLALLGVAREVAALTGGRVRVPAVAIKPTAEKADALVTVATADAALCPRYRALVIRGVTAGPSPGWMQRRLLYAGMRPINNLVDITNYVMLEYGQPLHAFDYDALVRRAGGKTPAITVRPAKAGEVLRTLDGQDRKLSPENLVIADAAGPIALAGVMGGAETEVTPQTTTVLLESASFDPVSIRKTARAFDLHSEASARFSKGVHPGIVPATADRAAFLMQEHASGKVSDGFAEAYPAPAAPQVVELPLAEVKRLLGVEVLAEEAERVLKSLEFGVERASGTLRVTVPPFRLDIQAGAADLVEELARVRGYDRLPTTMLSDPLPAPRADMRLAAEDRTRDLLAAAGLQEVVTYALTTPEREAAFVEGTPAYVTLLNPISSDRSAMRRTLLPGVLEAAAANLEHAGTVRLFEAGSVFVPRDGEKLPDEPRRLAVVLSGRRDEPTWADAGKPEPAALDFFDLKGVVESLLADLHVADVSFRPAKTAYLHPGQAAELLAGGASAGVFGQLHPKLARATKKFAGRAVLVADLDLSAILTAVPARYAAVAPPRYPAALRDVAVIVPEATPADRLLAELRAAGGALLREARLFDVYRGSSIPEGTKSLAYALAYQADDRTLTDKEVDKAHAGIVERLKKSLGAQIRGEEAAKG
jgi:phenylalanyl-tRNA synthetase beta chain